MKTLIIILTLLTIISASSVDITMENLSTLFGAELSDFANRQNPEPWFIMFHSPTCGHCKKAMP